MINFEATELRLGLPGDDKGETVKSNGKRGFLDTVDLKLNLSSTATEDELEKMKENNIKPHAKAQVVGWPPVRSYRKNIMSVKKPAEEEEKASASTAGLVKVSMDGAPYLRKLDLRLYKTYHELSDALSKMFSTFTHEYIPTYQDKDGDWMLVGDVPWEMFVDSCKRLRIMKEPEAIGPGQ